MGAVDDRTSKRSSTHPRRRRPLEEYDKKRDGFRNAERAFRRQLDDLFPLEPYRDSIGRNRTRGSARRKRAGRGLHGLAKRQSQVRFRTVYIGLDGLV